MSSVDSSVQDCDEGSDKRCEGSQREDGAVDESNPRTDAGDGDGDGDADASQVDEQPPAEDAEVDESTDETADPEPDAGSDAGETEPDAGTDAATEPDPIDCREYVCGFGTCDHAKAPAPCDCITGYADEGAGCLWTGAIADQDMEDASAWDGQHMAFSGGLARFENEGEGDACELGILEQTLQMPERAESQAFVIELDVLSSCTSSDPEMCPPLQVELGSSATRLVSAGAAGAGAAPVARKLTACLGDTGYGDDVLLRVRPALAYQGGELPLSCDATEWPAIDRIAIRPAAAGECPAFDTLNASPESTAGWSLEDATIAGDRLTIEAGGSAETIGSVTEAREGQYIFIGGTFDSALASYIDVRIDGLAWARMQGRGSQAICLPFWVHGGAHRVSFNAVGGRVVLQSFRMGKSDDCGDNSFDGGFNGPRAPVSWWTEQGMPMLGFGSTGQGAVLTASNTLRAATRFGSLIPGRTLVAMARLEAPGSQITVVDYAIEPGPATSFQSTVTYDYRACMPDHWEHQLATLRLEVMITPTNLPPRLFIDDAHVATVLPTACP